MKVILFIGVFIYALNANSYRSIQLYSAQGVDANLLNIPGFIITANIPFEPTYLTALGVEFGVWQHALDNGSTFLVAFTPVVAKHHGMQTHFETNIAVSLKYLELFLKNSPINSNIAFGQGLSYAFGTPYYEDPVPSESNPSGYYRLQSFLHVDIELYLKTLKQYALLFRVHHRSGIYGLVAPPKVGSNFLSLGVCISF